MKNCYNFITKNHGHRLPSPTLLLVVLSCGSVCPRLRKASGHGRVCGYPTREPRWSLVVHWLNILKSWPSFTFLVNMSFYFLIISSTIFCLAKFQKILTNVEDVLGSKYLIYFLNRRFSPVSRWIWYNWHLHIALYLLMSPHVNNIASVNPLVYTHCFLSIHLPEQWIKALNWCLGYNEASKYRNQSSRRDDCTYLLPRWNGYRTTVDGWPNCFGSTKTIVLNTWDLNLNAMRLDQFLRTTRWSLVLLSDACSQLKQTNSNQNMTALVD